MNGLFTPSPIGLNSYRDAEHDMDSMGNGNSHAISVPYIKLGLSLVHNRNCAQEMEKLNSSIQLHVVNKGRGFV